MTTIPAIAGRIAGTAARGLLWANDQIDWAEVGAIVLHGLQVLTVLALLAGRATRRAWDALLLLSERLGHWYARRIAPPLLVPTGPVLQVPAVAPAPIVTRRTATELALLTNRELRELVGVRKRLPKRELVELALVRA